ncbi:GAF and ANTAR domain-containing protein [Mycobacterium vicinigordonae]|uniref:GAF and ANTAR domain-containing protein n=1 Tax=Mycobacterium vicinigordonae TaxID=1719132 RepID=A0A7D6I958_9MYCO|nr:GAF and ANTAR domain-containing protein [Mycobacterium vicinigordonae]QLL07757.1 GAF and ANTAR domain-containing protein [Mycobacterium vicinigordonae]
MGEDIGELHHRIAAFARELHNRPGIDSQAAISQLVIEATLTVPGAQYAGLTVVNRQQEISTPASTHRYVTLLDEIQQRYLEGPCLIAAWEHHTVRVDDLTSDTRWPKYRRDALAETTIRSILSFELFTSSHSLGALNVYADAPNVFDNDAVDIGIVFATHAALAWDSVLREHSFQSALASRDLIGQAKGILMQQFDIDSVRAFDLLRRLSQESNTLLVDIARQVVQNRKSLSDS